MASIGKITRLQIRDTWRVEPRFSEWLSQNIEYLNEVLGLDITVQSTEENVGPYKVDVYGEDLSGTKVIIENQFGKTDHSHLGQILTYMVNLDAGITIWISERAVEEHRKVVEWLNETTPDDMSFFLVVLELIHIEGSSSIAPLFTLVEGPTKTSKKIGGAKKEFARRHTVRTEFWTQFIEECNKSNQLLKHVNPSTDAWLAAALGVSGISLNFVVAKNYARTEIFINKGDQLKNKAIFDALFAQKDQIEEEIGFPLVWERMEDRVTSRIKHQLDNVSVYDEQDWPTMTAFMVESSNNMYRVFRSRIQKLR